LFSDGLIVCFLSSFGVSGGFLFDSKGVGFLFGKDSELLLFGTLTVFDEGYLVFFDLSEINTIGFSNSFGLFNGGLCCLDSTLGFCESFLGALPFKLASFPL